MAPDVAVGSLRGDELLTARSMISQLRIRRVTVGGDRRGDPLSQNRSATLACPSERERSNQVIHVLSEDSFVEAQVDLVAESPECGRAPWSQRRRGVVNLTAAFSPANAVTREREFLQQCCEVSGAFHGGPSIMGVTADRSIMPPADF